MGRVSAFYRTVSERQASTREVSDDDVFWKTQNLRTSDGRLIDGMVRNG